MGYRSKFTGEQIDALLEKVGEGGGGNSGGSGSAKYFNAAGLGELYGSPTIFSITAACPVATMKTSKSGTITIAPTDAVITQLNYNVITADDILAIEIADTKTYSGGKWLTLDDALNDIKGMGITLTEITEEEFYNIG